MKAIFKPLLLAGLLAGAGFAALAQGPMGGGDCPMMDGGAMQGGMRHERMGAMDPAKMQSMMDKRSADLKAKLKLTPAQETGWTAFTAAIKPSADMMAKRPDHAEMAKLPTPERIDKMKALHTQRMSDMTAAMDKRGEATKTFYATLTPEQQKVFDANTMPQQRSQGGRQAPMQPMKP